ncbi:MAG: hypothetical protein ABH869_04995, partial [Candidatus Omnitrophota bacterium]
MRLAEFYLFQAQNSLVYLARKKNYVKRFYSGFKTVLKEESLYRGLPLIFIAGIRLSMSLFGLKMTPLWGLPIPFLGHVSLFPGVIFFSALLAANFYFVRSHKHEDFRAPPSKIRRFIAPAVLALILNILLPSGILPDLVPALSGVYSQFILYFAVSVLLHIAVNGLVWAVNGIMRRQLLGYALQQVVLTKGERNEVNSDLYDDIQRELTEVRLKRGTMTKGLYLQARKNNRIKQRIDLTKSDIEQLQQKFNEIILMDDFVKVFSSEEKEKGEKFWKKLVEAGWLEGKLSSENKDKPLDKAILKASEKEIKAGLRGDVSKEELEQIITILVPYFKEKLDEKIELAVSNLKLLTTLLFASVFYNKLYNGFWPWTRQIRKNRREYIRTYSKWLKERAEEFKKADMNDIADDFSGLNDTCIEQLSVEKTKSAKDRIKSLMDIVFDRERRLKKQEEIVKKKQGLIEELKREKEKIEKRTYSDLTKKDEDIKEIEDKIKKQKAELKPREEKLKTKVKAVMSSKKDYLIKLIEFELKDIKDPEAAKKIIERRIKKEVKSITELFDRTEYQQGDIFEFTEEVVVPVINKLIASSKYALDEKTVRDIWAPVLELFLNAILNKQGIVTKDVQPRLIVQDYKKIIDTFISQKEKISKKEGRKKEDRYVNKVNRIFSIIQFIKADKEQLQTIQAILSEQLIIISLNWLKEKSFMIRQQRKNETDLSYKNYLIRVKSLINKYKLLDAVLAATFLSASNDIQNAVYSALVSLLKYERSFEVSVPSEQDKQKSKIIVIKVGPGVLKKLAEKHASSDDLLSCKLRKDYYESTVLNEIKNKVQDLEKGEVLTLEPEQKKGLDNLFDLYLKLAEQAEKDSEKDDFLKEAVKLMAYYTKNENREKLFNKLVQKKLLNKVLIETLFNSELSQSGGISETIMEKVLFVLSDKKNQIIGIKENQISESDLLKMIRDLTNSDKVSIDQKKELLKTLSDLYIDSQESKVLERIGQLINFLNSLVGDIKDPEAYSKGIKTLLLFDDILSNLTENKLKIEDNEFENRETEGFISKMDLIISIRNLYAKVINVDFSKDDKDWENAIKKQDGNVTILNSCFKSSGELVKKLKQSEEKDAKRAFWEAKEKQYAAYILKAESLEIQGKHEDAIKEYEKIIELFDEEIHELEKDEKIKDFAGRKIQKDADDEALNQKQFILTGIEELSDSYAQILARRLVVLNNRVLTSLLNQERLNAYQDKKAEVSRANARLNMWVGLHSAQTVIVDPGKPFEQAEQALARMIMMDPDNPEIRKKYADIKAGDYLKALTKWQSEEKTMKELQEEDQKHTAQIGKLEEEKDKLKKSCDDKAEKVRTLEEELAVLRAKRIELDGLVAEVKDADTEKKLYGQAEPPQTKGVLAESKEKSAELQKAKVLKKKADDAFKGAEEKLKTLEEEKKTLTEKIEKSDKKKKEEKENKQKKYTAMGEDRKESLDKAIDEYLNAFAMASADNSKKEVMNKAGEQLEKCIYAHQEEKGDPIDSFQELMDKIEKQRDLWASTELDPQKRFLIEQNFTKLKQKLIEKYKGLNEMISKLASGSGDQIEIEKVQIPASDLLQYISEKLKEQNKTRELAKLLITVYLNENINNVTRITALQKFIDLVYEKLKLSEKKDLPDFDKILPDIIKDIFNYPALAEEPALDTTIKKAIQVSSLRGAKQMSPAAISAKLSGFVSFIEKLKTIYNSLQSRHKNIIDTIDFSKIEDKDAPGVKAKLAKASENDPELSDLVANINAD